MPIVRKFKVRSLDTHDFNVEPDIEGTIVELGVLDVKGDDRTFMVIDTGQRLRRVFHSTGLNEAFELGTPGDHIAIEFHGKVTITGGHTFNRFQVQVWEEEGTPDETKEVATPDKDQPVKA